MYACIKSTPRITQFLVCVQQIHTMHHRIPCVCASNPHCASPPPHVPWRGMDRVPSAGTVKAAGCRAWLWAGLESFFPLPQCEITNTFALTSSSTQHWTGSATSLCLQPAFLGHSRVSSFLQHCQHRNHPQELCAALTNLCFVLPHRAKGEAASRIISMKHCRHFGPQGRESAGKLCGKPAQSWWGQELPAEPPASPALCSSRPRALTLCFHCYGSGTFPF